jgi:hypothetical protein
MWQQILLKIRYFFSSEQELETVSLIHLEGWLVEQSLTVTRQSGVAAELEKYVQQCKEKRWVLECQLDEWQKRLTLNNLDIKTFLSKTRSVLELAEFNDDLLGSVLTFNKKLEEPLNKLIEKVENSPFAHSYSFILEKDAPHLNVNPLLKELIELKALRDWLEQKIVKSGLRALETLEGKRQKLEEVINDTTQLRDSVQIKKERLHAAQRKSKEKQEDLIKLQEVPEYKNLLAKKQEKQKLKVKLEGYESEVIKGLEELKHILKIYHRLDPQELVERYLQSPWLAFTDDEGLSFVHILQHLEAMIKAGKMQVEDSEENLKLIADLIEKLPHWQREQNKIRQQLDKVNKATIGDFLQKVEEAEYRAQHFRSQEGKMREELHRLEEELDDRAELIKRERYFFENLVRISIKRNIKIAV